MKKICVFIGSRANYSSIKSVMTAIDNHPKLELQLILSASAVLDKFGKIERQIQIDGFTIDHIFHNLVEGENPVTMVKSTGLGLIDMSTALLNLKPDVVIVVGDRFEMMSITLASAYMNIIIAHTMGGEVTGTIDESIRHAITKLSQIHFTANNDSRERVIKMGEDPNFVFNVGCPRLDLVALELQNNSYKALDNLFIKFGGVGEWFDLREPYLLVSQHSVTTEFGNSLWQIERTLEALESLSIPVIMLWPNPDAGSDGISRGIRIFREENNPKWLHVFKNLPPDIYVHLMNTTACLVGNSSSGLREGAFIGTPVVNIGTRQNNRLRAENVEQTGYDSNEILSAIKKQLFHGKYKTSSIYGDGKSSIKISKILSKVPPKIQKTISY
jgi:UDP-hydrolysing UDP-N-acetyl-D-glucosamine 2-epimerase